MPPWIINGSLKCFTSPAAMIVVCERPPLSNFKVVFARHKLKIHGNSAGPTMNDGRRGDSGAKGKSAVKLPGRPSEHLIEIFLERPDRHTKHRGHRECDTPIEEMAKARPCSIKPCSGLYITLVSVLRSYAMVSGSRSHSCVGTIHTIPPGHAAMTIERTRNVYKLTMVAILNVGFRFVNYGFRTNHNQSFHL